MVTFAYKPTLSGDLVVLRPIDAGDAEAMYADLSDDEGRMLTGTHASFTQEAVAQWTRDRHTTTDRLDLAVIDARSAEWYGEVVLNDWDPDNRSCGFRIALSRNARGRGFGTEATQLIVDYVFGQIDDPPVNRVALEVYAFNPRALRVYENVGFVREGVLRQSLRWNEQYVDAIAMSMLRSDWHGVTA